MSTLYNFATVFFLLLLAFYLQNCMHFAAKCILFHWRKKNILLNVEGSKKYEELTAHNLLNVKREEEKKFIEEIKLRKWKKGKINHSIKIWAWIELNCWFWHMQFLSTSYKLLNAIESNKHKTIDCKGKKSVWQSGTALKYCRQESNRKHTHTHT